MGASIGLLCRTSTMAALLCTGPYSVSAEETERALHTVLSLDASAVCADPTDPDQRTPVRSDLVKHLLMLADGKGIVSSTCEPIDGGRFFCTVGIGRDAAEVVWTRYYRFVRSEEDDVVAGSLECFTIP